MIACLGPVQAWAGPTEPQVPERRGTQQGVAPEQQLRAGTQQGVAPEQQLRAGTQQGVAPEQQLRAGTQQGIAPAQQMGGGTQQGIAPAQQMSAGTQQGIAPAQQMGAGAGVEQGFAPPPMALGAAQDVAAAQAAEAARNRLIMAGAGLLGTFWAASVLTAGILGMDGATPAPGKCLNPCAAAREERGSSAALLFPVAGPFIAMGTSNPSGAEAAGMAALGVGQLVGVALLTGGLLMPQATQQKIRPQKMKTQQAKARQVHVTPSLSPGRIGLSVSGSM